MLRHPPQHFLLVACSLFFANATPGNPSIAQSPKNVRAPSPERYDQRHVSGWNVYVRHDLLSKQKRMTGRAMNLLKKQLDEIIRVVPASAVKELQKVNLFFSPEYPGVPPKAEYHPGVEWLKKNGRDPVMVRSVEFTNVRIFLEETRRMPNFALHELSHAYHHRFLDNGFQNAKLRATHQRAKASGIYANVQRRDAKGRVTLDRAYALTNPQEYFAELSEAYFSKNDFFPFDREQLRAHDRPGFELIGQLWSAPAPN